MLVVFERVRHVYDEALQKIQNVISNFDVINIQLQRYLQPFAQNLSLFLNREPPVADVIEQVVVYLVIVFERWDQIVEVLSIVWRQVLPKPLAVFDQNSNERHISQKIGFRVSRIHIQHIFNLI